MISIKGGGDPIERPRVTEKIRAAVTKIEGRKRGRPPSADALTPAEKQRAYRERRRAKA